MGSGGIQYDTLFAKVVTLCVTEFEAPDSDTRIPIARAKNRRMKLIVRTVESKFSVCLILTEPKNPGSSLSKDIHHSSYKPFGDSPSRKLNILIIGSLPRLCQDRSTLTAYTNSQERRYLHHRRDPDWTAPRSDALGTRNRQSGA